MISILIFCVLVCESLSASLSRDMVDHHRYRAKRGGALSGGSFATPTDPNASMYGENQENPFERPPIRVHGAPKDPNASIYGKPPGYPSESSQAGVHGGPTDPNASQHGRPTSGIVIPGEPNRPPSGWTFKIPNPDGWQPGPSEGSTFKNRNPSPSIVIPTLPPSYIEQPGERFPRGAPTDPDASVHSILQRGIRGAPVDPNASIYGGPAGSPGGYGSHGAPNNPDASQFGRPDGFPGSAVGPHGAPIDPNASVHGYH